MKDKSVYGTIGMEAAVEVFYDLVLDYHPEFLSPQYDEFYEAALGKDAVGKKQKRKNLLQSY